MDLIVYNYVIYRIDIVCFYKKINNVKKKNSKRENKVKENRFKK